MVTPSPFKFLDAYDKADKDIFFGREKETEILYEKVFRNKFLLVYGASGIGKTSIINCGLANRFADTDWYELSIRRQGNLVDSIRERLIHAIQESNQFVRKKARRQLPNAEASITDLIHHLYLRCFKPIFLVFDQFEELFILGSDAEKAEVISTFKALGESEENCTLIIIMREEYLAELDDFEEDIPYFLTNRLRVEAMTRRQTETVVRKTVNAPQMGIEVQDPEITIPLIVNQISDDRTVQLAYLQVYLDRLYRRALKQGPAVFSPDLVRQTGELGDVMGLFLEEQMDHVHQVLLQDDPELSPDRLRSLLSRFVTLEGTKLPVREDELYDHLKPLNPSFIDAACNQLINGRILRFANGQYEVAHDSLAKQIAENISLEERKLREAKQLIDNRHGSYLLTGVLLDPKELGYVALYEDRLDLTADERSFLSKSRRQAQKRRQRLIAAILAFILIAGLAGIAIWNAKEANDQRAIVSSKADSLRIFSEDLQQSNVDLEQSKRIVESSNDSLILSKSRIDSFFQVVSAQKRKQEKLASAYEEVSKALLTLPTDPTEAFGYAVKGWEIDQNVSTRQALYDIYGAYPQYRILVRKEPSMIPMAMSPDGQFLAVNPSRKRTEVRLENLSGKSIGAFEASDYVRKIKFSPDGRYLLVGTDDGGYLWDRQKGLDSPQRLNLSKGADVVELDFSARGDSFIVELQTGDIYLWQLANPDYIKTFSRRKDLASISSFEEVKLPIQDIVPLLGHTEPITEISYSTDRKKLFSMSRDGTIREWQLPVQLLSRISFQEGRIRTAAFTADGQSILAGTNFGAMGAWKVGGQKIKSIPSIPDEIVDIQAISSDGKSCIGLGEDDAKELFFLSSSGKVLLLKGHKRDVTVASFSPDARFMVSGSMDHSVRLWDMTGQEIALLNGHTGTISALAVSPDGTRILSGSLDNTARVWNKQGRELARFSRHADQVSALDMSKDNTRIVTGSKDQTLKLWTATGSLIKSMDEHDAMITAARFSPDGQWILSGDAAGELRMWTRRGDIHMVLQMGSSIQALAFSPDSRDFFVACADGQIYLWKPIKADIKDFLQDYKILLR